MYCEAAFQRVPFRDLRPGDVLADVPNLAVIIASPPIRFRGENHALALIHAFTPEGTEIGHRDRPLSIVDEIDAVRVVAARDRPDWRPTPPITTVERLIAGGRPIDENHT